MKSLIAAVLCLVAPLSVGFALTADQVAAFLGMSHWETTVTMPRDSFDVSITPILDGKLVPAGMTCSFGEYQGNSTTTKLLIIGQMEQSPNSFAVFVDGNKACSRGFPEVPATTNAWQALTLPAEIGPGDYILGGQSFGNGFSVSESLKVESYKVGYLLIIAKRTDEQK
jgi:hypothetical protein